MHVQMPNLLDNFARLPVAPLSRTPCHASAAVWGSLDFSTAEAEMNAEAPLTGKQSLFTVGEKAAKWRLSVISERMIIVCLAHSKIMALLGTPAQYASCLL